MSKHTTLDWLNTVPPSDQNFKSALERATGEELEEALTIALHEGQKTKYNAIRSRLNAHRKECIAEGGIGPFIPEPKFEEALAALQADQEKDEIQIGRMLDPNQNPGTLTMLVREFPRLAETAWERATGDRKAQLARLLKKPSAAPGGTALAAPSEPPTQALTVVAPGTLSPAPSDLADSSDTLMGQQLTEQYHRAVGGMREVLRFGAMMMALREKLRDSTRGVALGNKDREGTGLKAWLSQHAPEVKEATAYRFLHVAEAVAAEFQGPAKISFVDLATKTPEELPEKFRSKQLELWEFVNGTSQRSWLDRFAPAKTKGGYHPRQNPAPDPNAPLPDNPPDGWLPHLWDRYRSLTPEQRLAWDLLYIPAFKVFTEFERSWAFLPDAERDELDGWLLDMRTKIKSARDQAATKAKRK